MTLDVLVIGAGVSGLTTAVALAEAGMNVNVVSAEPPEQTTSAAAGAMWGPYLVEPRDQVRRWSAESLTEFSRLADDPASGVRLAPGIEASRTPCEPPDWGDLVPDLRICDQSELPGGFISGWRFTVPLIDMTTYLGYLLDRLRRAGGRVEYRKVTSLAEVRAPLVVNCAGMGAVDLANDERLYPIHGQLIVTENPGITAFFSEDTGPSEDLLCIYPHADTVVLGGTAVPGRADRRPDPKVAEQILRRCTAIEPRLGTAKVIAHRTGLRPTRPQVRVEQEHPGLIHNYGHGGAGVTLSWGCARQVAAMATRH